MPALLTAMTQRGRALQRVAVAAALTVAVAGLVALLSVTAPFHYLGLKAYDTYLSRVPWQQDPRIVLVLVDEKSRAAFPEPMILWNRHYADLFRGLALGGAYAISEQRQGGGRYGTVVITLRDASSRVSCIQLAPALP
jgi:CHASE2 domain-containing sensor protein